MYIEFSGQQGLVDEGVYIQAAEMLSLCGGLTQSMVNKLGGSSPLLLCLSVSLSKRAKPRANSTGADTVVLAETLNPSKGWDLRADPWLPLQNSSQ